MSRLDTIQLEDAFANSQSGKGVRLAEVEHLRDFASYTRTRAAVVCNVETFEVRGDYEISRSDLSIYQGGAEEQALPQAERVVLSEEALQEVLAAIEQEGIRCVFQVWADEL
jgi:hypothetical protein